MKLASHLAIYCLLLALCGTALADTKDNKIYNDLITQGIAMSDGTMVKLPVPTMADGLDADKQEEVIAKVVKLTADPQKKFRVGGATDPIATNYEVIKPAKPAPKQPIVRRCDLYFIAKGNFASVADPNFIKKEMEGPNGTNGFYTDKELTARNLKVINNNDVQERYVHAIAELIDLVLVSASTRAMETKESNSLIVAFEIDPRLENDQAYPNQWQSITRGAGGVRQLGPKNPYQGMAAYAKVTPLAAQPDRVFVEYHVAYEEPFGWFQGGPNLSSKLTEEYRRDATKFRKDLLSFGKTSPAGGTNSPAAAGTKAAVANPAAAGTPAADAKKADAPKSDASKTDDKAKGSGK